MQLRIRERTRPSVIWLGMRKDRWEGWVAIAQIFTRKLSDARLKSRRLRNLASRHVRHVGTDSDNRSYVSPLWSEASSLAIPVRLHNYL